MSKLSKEEIKQMVKDEKKIISSFKDEVDLSLDKVVQAYERKELNEETFRAFVSLILLNATKSAVSDMTQELLKRNLNLQSENSNKVFLLNYSKHNYA